VNTNAAALCPAPWHVPTSDDFDALVAATNAAELIAAWGYGGEAYRSPHISQESSAFYWSSTLSPSDSHYAIYLAYDSRSVYELYFYYKDYGYQVRCVK
jgi:hypothetical protein